MAKAELAPQRGPKWDRPDEQESYLVGECGFVLAEVHRQYGGTWRWATATGENGRGHRTREAAELAASTQLLVWQSRLRGV